MLPYFLDWIPRWLGLLYARAVAWRPEGKRVELVVDETADPELFHTVLLGTVVSTGIERGRPGEIVIQLDRGILQAGRLLERLTATPRFAGHDSYRLPVTWAAVNLSDEAGGVLPFRGILRLRKIDAVA